MPNAGSEHQSSHLSIFEKIKRVTEEGFEFWQSRELGEILQYGEYRSFEPVIAKARLACVNSNQNPDDHFGDTTEMVAIGSNAQRELPVVLLRGGRERAFQNLPSA